MQSLKLVIATVSVLASPAAWAQFPGFGSDDIQIIGGNEVSAGSAVAASTVAVIAVKEKAMATCTGSLLTNDLVVTAAHCIEPGFRIGVAFVQDLNGTEGLVVPAQNVVVHPYYAKHSVDKKDTFDIALIRIKTRLPAGYAPAEILEDESLLERGRQVTLAGYGTTTGDPTVKNTSGRLRETKIKISDPAFSNTEVLLDQSHGKGACHGDSGGPAFVKVKGKLQLFGVTSRGEGDEKAGECGQDVVYTNILAHTDFLVKAAKALRAADKGE